MRIDNGKIAFEIRVPSPCCGPNMMKYGELFDYKIYVCKNCFKWIPRKQALPLIREARKLARQEIRKTIVLLRGTNHD